MVWMEEDDDGDLEMGTVDLSDIELRYRVEILIQY